MRLLVRVVCYMLALAPLVARADAPFELAALQGKSTRLVVAGHTVTVHADGMLAIDATTQRLIPADYKARVTRTSHELIGTTLTLVVEFEQPTTRHDKPVWDLGGAIIAKLDLATGRVVWRYRASNFERDRGWNLIATPRLLYVRDRHGLVAIDRATGADTWRLDHDYMRSALEPRIYDTMRLAGDTLAVTGHYYSGEQRADFAIELDAATGLRVYKTLPYVAPEGQPIYVRPGYRLEYPGDRAPPRQPTEWDGLHVGYAYLAWNKQSREGIVINPTKNDARAIIQIAKSIRGVRWLAVYATRAAIKQSALEDEVTVLKRHGRKVGDGDQIILKYEYNGQIVDSGEVVDASTVATALGAKLLDRDLDKPLATTAGPVLAYHDLDTRCSGGCAEAKLRMSVTWGPYTFFDAHYESYRHGPL